MNENEISKNIHEMFETASSLILQDSINDADFRLCMNTIMISLDYLKEKRMDTK